MEPISSNSATTLVQPKAAEEKQARDDSEAQTRSESQTRSSSDSFSSSNPVSELQLQRSQVVVDLGRAQQSGLETSQPFPAAQPSERNINSQAEAEALSQQLQQQIGDNPSTALDAQASQASQQTTLTLFQ